MPDPDAWMVSDHAAERYILRLAPRAEPYDLAAEPGMTTARARVRNLLRGELTVVGWAGPRVRVSPNPRAGAVLVCDEKGRTVITCYIAEGKERLRLEQSVQRHRQVEQQVRRYRYAYMAHGRRWPGWLR